MELARGVAFLCRFPNGLEKSEAIRSMPSLSSSPNSKFERKKNREEEGPREGVPQRCLQLFWSEVQAVGSPDS